MKELERCLKPALDNRIIENVFITGSPGTGETLMAKWIPETNLKEDSVFMSCWDYHHTHEARLEIVNEIYDIIRERAEFAIKPKARQTRVNGA